jgi:hypothetical protein
LLDTMLDIFGDDFLTKSNLLSRCSPSPPVRPERKRTPFQPTGSLIRTAAGSDLVSAKVLMEFDWQL